MGGGLRAALLDTIPASPVAPLTGSKNVQVGAIRVTSELARFEDPFVRCAGCGVGQGRRAPMTREHREINFHQKNTCDLEDLFFVFLPNGAQRLIFTMNYHLRDDRFLSILPPNWPNPTSGLEGPSGIQLGHNLTQSD